MDEGLEGRTRTLCPTWPSGTDANASYPCSRCIISVGASKWPGDLAMAAASVTMALKQWKKKFQYRYDRSASNVLGVSLAQIDLLCLPTWGDRGVSVKGHCLRYMKATAYRASLMSWINIREDSSSAI